MNKRALLQSGRKTLGYAKTHLGLEVDKSWSLDYDWMMGVGKGGSFRLNCEAFLVCHWMGDLGLGQNGLPCVQHVLERLYELRKRGLVLIMVAQLIVRCSFCFASGGSKEVEISDVSTGLGGFVVSRGE